MSVVGKSECGKPDGRGMSGASLSWRVEIFFRSSLLRRVMGAMARCLLVNWTCAAYSHNYECASGARCGGDRGQTSSAGQSHLDVCFEVYELSKLLLLL